MSGSLLVPSQSRREGLALAAACVVLVAAVLWWGRVGWFSVDAWDWLADRSFSSADDWFRPHGSHWTAFHFVVLRGSYLFVGLDWWPWYPLLNAAVLSGTLVVLHVQLRRRGVSVAVALLVATGTTFLWVWSQPAHLGRPVGVAATVFLATQLGRADRGSKVTTAAAGLVAVTSGPAAALAGVVATVVAVAVPVLRRHRWWWPPLVPLVAYTAWRATWLGLAGGGDGRPRIDLVELGRYAVDVIGAVFATPAPLSGLLAVALLGSVVALAARRRLDLAAVVMLGTVGLLALVTTMLRDGGDYGRWGDQVVPLVVIAVAPTVSRRARHVLALVLALAGVAALAGPADDVARIRQERRDVFPAVAALQADREPLHPGPSTVSLRLYGYLTPAMVDRLLADGYDPGRPSEASMEVARGERRVLGWPAGRASGGVLAGLEGCTPVDPDAVWRVVGAGTVVVTDTDTVRWRWRDAFGTGSSFYRPPGTQRRVVLHIAEGPATVSLAADAGAQLCG